jgi:fumarate reductase flavoprotein subunit
VKIDGMSGGEYKNHFRKGTTMDALEADVAVVAAGASGLAAAIAAAEGGAKVIALEKGSTTGGAGNMGMGALGIESGHTRASNFRPTKDEAFEILKDRT